MSILDRYIFKSIVLTCAAAVGLFAFVLMLGNAIKDLLGYVLAGQLSYPITVELILLLVPFVISYALPMGVLTGVLLVLGRLSADSEITAMRASGIGLVRIARPVVLIGVLGMAAGLYFNFKSMPWAKVKYERLLTEAVRANPLRFIVPRTYIRDFPGIVVYVDAKEGEVVRNLDLYQLDKEGRVLRILRANEGRVRFDEASNELILTLTHTSIEARDPQDPEDFSKVPWFLTSESIEPTHLSLDRVLGQRTDRQKLQWMTYDELLAEDARLAALAVEPDKEEQRTLDRLKVALTLHEKANMALAVLSFSLIGVPLGITVSRRETSANLGLATLLALGYYFLTVMVGWLDQKPEFRPELLFWVPNLIFLILAAWLFRRARSR